MRPTSRAVRAGAAAVLAVVLCALAAIAFLTTQTGRDAVARLAEHALSDEEMTVRIDAVGGNLLSDFRLGTVSLADRAGNVVIVEDTRVAWRPLSLLRGIVDLRALRIRHISTDAFGADASPADAEAEPPLLPPLSIRIEALTVDEIALGPAMLGEPQRLSLSATAALDSGLGHARLLARLARSDGAPGHADIAVDYATDPARFAARVDIEEPDGGPVARLAGLPPGTPLSVKLDGAGPPDAWRGTLAMEAGGRAGATADLLVALRDGSLSLTLDGTAALAALLPRAARPFAEPAIAFRGTAEYGADGAFAVRGLEADSAALSLAAAGRYAPSDGAVNAELSFTLRDGAAVSAAAPGLALGGARLHARLGGTIGKPSVDGRIRVDGLSVDALTAASVEGEARLSPASGEAFALSGAFRFGGVEAPAGLPDGLLGPALALRLDGRVRPDGTVPRLALSAASGAAEADIEAALDRAGIAAGRYELRHGRIGPLAGHVGLPLRGGALRAAGGFRTDLASGNTHLEIAGALSGLAADASWLTATLGDRVALSGVLRWDGADRLSLAGLEARSPAARLRGSAVMQPRSGRIDARYAVSMAGLGPLSPLAGVPLAGSLSATGAVAGTVGAPRISAQAAVRDLVVQGVALGSVTAGLAARPGASGLEAALRLGGDLGGKTLDGTVALSFAGATVRVPQLDIAIGRNAIAGELTIDSARPRLAGAVTATLADLADIPALAGLPPLAAGEGTVRLRASTTESGTGDDGGTQEIAIDAEATGIAAGGGRAAPLSAGRLTAALVLRDPFAAASVAGRIGLSDLKTRDVAVGKAELAVSGTPAALDWTLTAAGEEPAPLSLSAGGSLSLDGGRGTLAIRRLQGKVAAHALALRAPATIAWAPGGLTAGPVDLSVDGGGIRLSVSRGGDAVEAVAEASDLPLALAGLFDPRLELRGTLSGSARVAGSPRNPSVDMSLRASGLRLRALTEEMFAGLDATADLRQNADDLRLRLTVSGPEDTAATAALRTPPILSLTPFRLAPPPDAPLAGEIDASGRLALVEGIIGLAGDRLDGRIAARARLSGTAARPELRGDADLTGGAYQDVSTGIVIRDATARLVFTGNEARLAALSATDGSGGRISGSGALAFAGQPAGTGGLSIVLDRFAALRRPEAEIVASGTLAVQGPFDGPAVAGELTVDRGELRIPDRLPAGVVELDVIEINGPDPVPRPRGGAAAGNTRAVPVSLDIAVDFPGRTFLRGRGLDSEWKGALHIAGTAASPAVTGALSVVRGTFAFAGKTFQLNSGSVSFAGEQPVAPEIAATAEAGLESVLARVEIAGPAASPDISITSEPPLPQEEVLARILFGQTTGQLSALQAARLAQTAAALSGTGSGAGIVDRVRRALGVDVLDVGEAGGDGGGATLKAGKYLTDDVFVSVTQGAEPGSQKVGVEVEVLPNVSVESDISGAASSNVGVNWKFDY